MWCWQLFWSIFGFPIMSTRIGAFLDATLRWLAEVAGCQRAGMAFDGELAVKAYTALFEGNLPGWEKMAGQLSLPDDGAGALERLRELH